jgi:hypothetical protein
VTNAGPSDSGDTSVTIGPLPSGLTITSAGDNCSLSNSADPEATTYDTAKCDVGNLTASGDGASTSQSVDISTDPSVLGVVTIPASTQGTSDDPSTDHNATSAGIEIDAVADLSLSLSLNPATNVIAGGSPFTAHAEVSNLGPSNSHGEDVTFTLPSGDLTFGSLPGSCGSPVGQSVSCSLGDLAQGDPAAVVEIPINAKASALGTYHVLASVASDVSSEPGGDSLLNDNADTTVGVIAQADLDITSVAASPSLICANSGASPVPTAACPDTGTTVQNIESFTVTLVNHGPSDSRTTLLTVAPPPQSGGGVDLLGQYDYCVDPCGGTYTPLPLSRQISLGASGELPPNSPQTIYVRARALSPLRHGIYTNLAQSFSVSTSTSPVPSPVGVTTRSSSPMFSIATVPEPVQGVSAVPGNGLAVVTWHPTPTSSNGGQSVNSYLITLTPPAGSGLSKVTKSILASATPVVCPDTATTTCLQGTVTGLQNDVKVAGVAASYTADVQAVNAVGPSDIDPGTGGSEASVRPSVDAAATSVATNTASSITTCTTATTTHPTCVSYSIPSGAGGVFGAQGNVPLTNFTCPLSTTNTCFAGTGAFSIGALTGYAYTNPLVESVTWDYSTIPTCDKKPKPNPCIATSPVCPNNSTSTSCYPNTIPIFYETSAALKLGLPATYLNSPSAPHFCALKAPLGAGNQGFARKPPTTDSSGTACIKKINILGSKSDPAANGDVQAQFNLDSGSDALAGHH